MSEIKQRMSPAELREACICAAASAVVAYALGYGYEDIAVYDDGGAGRRPTRRAGLLAMIRGRSAGASLSCDAAYRDIATIYEVAGLASRKLPRSWFASGQPHR